jgi:hypothetical protein
VAWSKIIAQHNLLFFQDVKEGAFLLAVSSNSLLKIIAQHNLLFVKMLKKGLFQKLLQSTIWKKPLL